jgi:alkanesulfonate monooxygenase SsuD/methylene tetrahydromethanopterin reductase-like flavin-dependent oxidoreductase (luciferase family)
VTEGGTIKVSFEHSMDLAKKAEKWGYHRYWLAEHHNMEGAAFFIIKWGNGNFKEKNKAVEIFSTA